MGRGDNDHVGLCGQHFVEIAVALRLPCHRRGGQAVGVGLAHGEEIRTFLLLAVGALVFAARRLQEQGITFTRTGGSFAFSRSFRHHRIRGL